jgi:hypothetical protein
LKAKIEGILTNFCTHHNDVTGDFVGNAHYDDSGHTHDFDRKERQVEIKDIQFAFNNSEIIKKLRVRGELIMHHKYHKLEKMDEEITKYI